MLSSWARDIPFKKKLLQVPFQRFYVSGRKCAAYTLLNIYFIYFLMVAAPFFSKHEQCIQRMALYYNEKQVDLWFVQGIYSAG